MATDVDSEQNGLEVKNSVIRLTIVAKMSKYGGSY